MRTSAAIAVALAIGLAAPARSAHAMPQVEIKAQTRLSLTKVALIPQDPTELPEAEVTGQLTDKLTGDGIAGQKVAIAIGDATVFATTRADGTFVAVVPAAPGEQTVTLSYRGAGAVDPAQALQVVTDPSRAQVALSIAKVGDDASGARLMVSATVDDQPATLTVDIATGAPGDGALTKLADVHTGTAFLVARARVGGAGPHRVRATFAGDPSRQAATIESTIELTSGSTTTMQLSASSLAFEDDLVVTGVVRDDDGAPLPRSAVTLSSKDRRLAQGLTADDGSYKLSIEAEQLGAGDLVVQVQGDPTSAAITASRSTPAEVHVSAPQPVPVSYTLAAFIATIAAAGGFLFARAKPWRRLARRVPAAEAPPTVAADEAIAPATGGLVANRPSIVSTLRRPADFAFTGVVRDAVRGRALAEAVVRLVLEAPSGVLEHEVRTHSDGSFAIDKIAAGEWRAEAAAPGHVTENFVVSIPHRGELRNVRIDLVPVRERVFELYRRAAEPVLPNAKLWGVWSPRQIVDHVKARQHSPALVELTDFVEEIYFSPRLAAETVLPGASDKVDRAIRERMRVPAAAAPAARS